MANIPYLDLPFLCQICGRISPPTKTYQFGQKLYRSGKSRYTNTLGFQTPKREKVLYLDPKNIPSKHRENLSLGMTGRLGKYWSYCGLLLFGCVSLQNSNNPQISKPEGSKRFSEQQSVVFKNERWGRVTCPQSQGKGDRLILRTLHLLTFWKVGSWYYPRLPKTSWGLVFGWYVFGVQIPPDKVFGSLGLDQKQWSKALRLSFSIIPRLPGEYLLRFSRCFI